MQCSGPFPSQIGIAASSPRPSPLFFSEPCNDRAAHVPPQAKSPKNKNSSTLSKNIIHIYTMVLVDYTK